LFGLVCCLSLAAADVAQLLELQEQNRIFELRAAIEQPGWNASETIFYRAVVAVRFGREPAGIQLLQKFLATQPDPEMERKADEELASALARTGRYGEAARAWADALRLTPPDASGRADDENTRVLYEAMRGFPLQTIEFGNELPMQAMRNAVGSWDVPVIVNGRQGEWIFDTGANQSVITESEAAGMKLSVRETTAYVSGRRKSTMRCGWPWRPIYISGRRICATLSSSSLPIGRSRLVP
jgi:tetratricopeptide (TPR) repeat protein